MATFTEKTAELQNYFAAGSFRVQPEAQWEPHPDFSGYAVARFAGVAPDGALQHGTIAVLDDGTPGNQIAVSSVADWRTRFHEWCKAQDGPAPAPWIRYLRPVLLNDASRTAIILVVASFSGGTGALGVAAVEPHQGAFRSIALSNMSVSDALQLIGRTQ